MFYFAMIILVSLTTAVSAAAADNHIIARNQDSSISVSRSDDVYICSRDAGTCATPDVVCPPPSKRECQALLKGVHAGEIIVIAPRCDGNNCKHPST